MKALILAAGLGKRLRPLTLERPKPMVLLSGKPLLAHLFEVLPAAVKELVIVTGYKGEVIREHFGEQHDGRAITYVEQVEPRGTADAILLCRHLIGSGERFLLVYADDLHSKRAMEQMLNEDLAVLVKETGTPEKFGIVECDDSNHIVGIEEKPGAPKSNLAAVGAYLLDDRIFAYPPVANPATSELYLTDMIKSLIQDHHVRAVVTDFWHPIATPDDILAAEKLFS